MIQTISRNAKRLQRLTEDILDVTRIETQSLKLNVERVNLNELISDIIEDQKNEIEKTNKDIRLVHERQDQIIEIDADKNRLTQVISNLLSNAIKFTREGTIRVTEEVKDSMALVTVMDTGRGIDPEISPRLFLKFALNLKQVWAWACSFLRALWKLMGARYGLRIILIMMERRS